MSLFDKGKEKATEIVSGLKDKFNSVKDKGKDTLKKLGIGDDDSADEPDKKDFCACPPEDSKGKSNNRNNKSDKDKIKAAIDKIFDPLDSSKGAYSSAGYTPSSITANPSLSYKITYDLVNLEPNNPYDIYYRDDDKLYWDRNRKANTREVSKNIYQIHTTIVEPIRARVNEMYGDKVTVRVHYCFMCRASLTKNRLPIDHLFSKARAVILNIEGEKASLIYADLIKFCSENNDEIDINDKESPKPFNYGIMKICEQKENREWIYVTLPFTEEELAEDELLSKNKSNFYYSNSNNMGMSPDAATSTKIFPAYKNDNEVEDFFNEIDDIEETLNEIEKKIDQAKESENFNELERLKEEKFIKEQEKNNLTSPNFDIPELELEKKKAEELYKKFPTEANKKKIELAVKELNKYPSSEDTLTISIGKINSMSVTIMSSLDITDEHTEYFNAKKMIELNKAIRCREAMLFNSENDIIKEKYDLLISEYNSIKEERLLKLQEEYIREKTEHDRLYEETFNNKIKELYPNGFPNANIPPITINMEPFNKPFPNIDSVDMSDIEKPSLDDMINNEKEKFDSVLIELRRIYDKMDIEALDNIITDFPMNIISFSNDRINSIEKTEFSKFKSLTELVKECDNYSEAVKAKRDYNSYPSMQSFFKSNNFSEFFNWLLIEKIDFEEMLDFYLDIILKDKKSIEGIENKINRSRAIALICRDRNFNINLSLPSGDEEYVKHALKYLDIEMKYYSDTSEYEKVSELDKLKNEYLNYYQEKEYDKVKIEDFKSDIFEFGDNEYEASKIKYLTNIYENLEEDETKRIIAYIVSLVIEDKANISDMEYYTICNQLGKESLDNQVASNMFDEIYKDTKNWLSKQEKLKEIDSIPNSILDTLIKIDNYVTGKVSALNNYITKHNHYILNITYNPDMNVRINKVYNSNKRNYSFVDYGTEYITLNKQIGDSLNADDDDKFYRVRLKQDRLMMKRQLIYIRLDENSKKISNYELESVAAIDFGKVNRFKQITKEIIPEIKRLKELKDNFTPIDDEVDNYENIKRLEKERLAYLYSLNLEDISLLYRKATIEVVMDYENERGLFENLNKSKDEKYILYLEELIKALVKENNSALNDEILHLRAEILYVKDENNEKKNKRNELNMELMKRKMEIEKEFRKRQDDLKYLHFTTRINDIENYLKLKYKEFIKIESLPSKGVELKFPFLLFEDFKLLYNDIIKSPTILSEYEIIDSYHQYSKINYNYFDRNKERIVNQWHDIWKNISYEPPSSTMIPEPKDYIILADSGSNVNFTKSIGRALYCINGILDMDTVIVTNNNIEFNNGILVKIRRTEDFIDDLKYLLNVMCKQDTKLIDSIKVIESNL